MDKTGTGEAGALSDWKRFEQVKGQRDSGYASLMKDGRLILPKKVCETTNWQPGQYVEIYYKDDDESGRQVGLKNVGNETIHSIKISVTGPISEYNNPDATRYCGLVISLRSLLSQRGIVLSQRIRGRCAWDEATEMVVFYMGKLPVTAAKGAAALVTDDTPLVEVL